MPEHREADHDRTRGEEHQSIQRRDAQREQGEVRARLRSPAPPQLQDQDDRAGDRQEVPRVEGPDDVDRRGGEVEVDAQDRQGEQLADDEEDEAEPGAGARPMTRATTAMAASRPIAPSTRTTCAAVHITVPRRLRRGQAEQRLADELHDRGDDEEDGCLPTSARIDGPC